MTWLLAFVLIQDARPQADRIRAAMAASVQQQRESIQKQVQATHPAIASISCDPIAQPELSKLIDDVAGRQGVDKRLVKEVARQESGFDPCAVSGKGAQGLMQLMPATQAQFQVADPFDPRQSLEAGSKLLKTLLDKYHGDLALALSAYNAGAGTVDRSGGVPEIPETKAYVLSILTRFMQ